jgi:cell wall-associated NlpC family hydrolase
MMNKSPLSTSLATKHFTINAVKKQRNTCIVKRVKLVCSTIAITLLLVSCGSSRPKVITTKAEAREYQQQTAAVSRPAARRNISRNTRERPDTDPEEEVIVMEEPTRELTITDIAINKAMQYEGVRYRYGGSTDKGMDCSGLLHISFAEAGETVPRTSMTFFQTASPIEVKEVRKGDLMFFATGRDRKKINHVALVVEVTPAEVRFVHATVSQGVTVSSLNEPYWLGKYRSSGRLF